MPQEKIISEVTGKVWKILVQPGSKVEVDDPVMIVESMKMEIPILATLAGVVTAIMRNEGDAVEDGQVVAIVQG